ncbi:hypothetical protein [Kumtagia ephedrae]|uniref:hypothetical protein n=1 Tax=Kumtagia ephedrae TaxID=2116701 RepID=UPI0014027182|nr:hypothetical protein [Mesorhizobium ephedrae]
MLGDKWTLIKAGKTVDEVIDTGTQLVAGENAGQYKYWRDAITSPSATSTRKPGATRH